MRPHNRQCEKKVRQAAVHELRVCHGLLIDIPKTFYWPFPMWPMNTDRPFRKEVERTSDMPLC